MRVSGIMTATLAMMGAVSGNSHSNVGKQLGRKNEFYKPLSLVGNSTNVTSPTPAPIESGYVSAYPECRVDRISVNAESDAAAFYNELYSGFGDAPLKAEYDTRLANSGLTDVFDQTDFILEFYINEYTFVKPTLEKRILYLQTDPELTYNCIDTTKTPYVSAYPECRADDTASNSTLNSFYEHIYVFDDTVKADYSSKLTDAGLTSPVDKLNFLLEYCINNPWPTVGYHTTEDAIKWFQNPENFAKTSSCIDTRPNAQYYEQCRADVNSSEEQMEDFYNNIKSNFNSDVNADYNLKLSQRGLASIKDKLDFILEYCIDNPPSIGWTTSEETVKWFQNKSNFGNVHSCIDTTKVKYISAYPECRADVNSDMDRFYAYLYIPMESTLRSQFNNLLSDEGLTSSEDKLNLIIEFAINNPSVVNKPDSQAVKDYLKSGELGGFKCIDTTVTSLPTTSPTPIPVSDLIDHCKADRTQSVSDTLGEVTLLYTMILSSSSVYADEYIQRIVNVTDFYLKLDAMFEYCITTPEALFFDTPHQSYTFLSTEGSLSDGLITYSACSEQLNVTSEFPSPFPTGAPSSASSVSPTQQPTPSQTSALSTNPTSAPSVNSTSQLVVVDCTGLSDSEKYNCLLIQSLVITSNNANRQYNIDFGLRGGSFQDIGNGLLYDANLMINTYNEFEALVPSLTYASGASVFKGMSLGCQVSAITILDSDVTSTYSSLNQFMTLCKESIKSDIKKESETIYTLIQGLLLDRDVTLENINAINDETSIAYTGESSSLRTGQSRSFESGLVRGADGKFHFGLFPTLNQVSSTATSNGINAFNGSVTIDSTMKRTVDFTAEAEESYHRDPIQNYVLMSLGVVCLINLGLSLYALLYKGAHKGTTPQESDRAQGVMIYNTGDEETL